MQDILTASVIFTAIAFPALMIFDFAVNVIALWNQSQPQPEVLSGEYIHALDFELNDYTLTAKALELIERACSLDLPATQDLPDPWESAADDLIESAPVSIPASTPLPNLRLLLPAKELPVVQTKRVGRPKKEVQTKVQKPVAVAPTPTKRGRPRKTA